MRRLTVLIGLLLIGTGLTAAPAQAAAFGVSLTLSHPKADVGQVIRLSGSVSGKKAAKKTLLLQRRVGSGPWVTIARPKTTKKKQYVVNHRVSAVGGQQFRVVAPKRGKTTTGSSPVRAFSGWTWLWLAQQPMRSIGNVGIDETTSVAGTAYPHSISVRSYPVDGDPPFLAWSIGQSCDQARIAITQSSDGLSEPVTFRSNLPTIIADTAADTARPVSGVVTTATRYLFVERDTTGSTISLLSPRVHCSVSRLPPVGAL